MNIEQAKKDLLKTMESIDKEKLSLADLRLYAETLKVVSEIQTKSFSDMISESMSAVNGFGMNYKAPTVGDMK